MHILSFRLYLNSATILSLIFLSPSFPLFYSCLPSVGGNDPLCNSIFWLWCRVCRECLHQALNSHFYIKHDMRHKKEAQLVIFASRTFNCCINMLSYVPSSKTCDHDVSESHVCQMLFHACILLNLIIYFVYI